MCLVVGAKKKATVAGENARHLACRNLKIIYRQIWQPTSVNIRALFYVFSRFLFFVEYMLDIGDLDSR
jgi:hypothetical protein